MTIFSLFRRRTSADAIALLAQAHAIHQAEIEFAREEARAEARRELCQKVRDSLMRIELKLGWSPADSEDKFRCAVGEIFCETPDQRLDWYAFVRECRIATQDGKYEELSRKIHGGPRSHGGVVFNSTRE
jgi:hypothetical protein